MHAAAKSLPLCSFPGRIGNAPLKTAIGLFSLFVRGNTRDSTSGFEETPRQAREAPLDPSAPAALRRLNNYLADARASARVRPVITYRRRVSESERRLMEYTFGCGCHKNA